jgi:hypothetical protein
MIVFKHSDSDDNTYYFIGVSYSYMNLIERLVSKIALNWEIKSFKRKFPKLKLVEEWRIHRKKRYLKKLAEESKNDGFPFGSCIPTRGYKAQIENINEYLELREVALQSHSIGPLL